MKNKLLSVLIGFSLVSHAMSGGDIEHIQTPKTNIETSITNSSFYFGVGYGNTMHKHDVYSIDLGTTQKYFDENFHSLLIQAGYQINSYFALEGRYWFGFDNTFTVNQLRQVESSIDTWAIYIKPIYPVTEEFNVYALLGYAGVKHDVNGNPPIPKSILGESYNNFSWGLGVSYTITEKLSLFVDYVNIYDDKKSWIHPIGGWGKVSDEKIDMWSIGTSYKF